MTTADTLLDPRRCGAVERGAAARERGVVDNDARSSPQRELLNASRAAGLNPTRVGAPRLLAGYVDVRSRGIALRALARDDLFVLELTSPMLAQPARIPLQRHHLEHLLDLMLTDGTAGRLDLGAQRVGRMPGLVVPIVRVIHGQIETQTTMLRHVNVIAERRGTMSTTTLRYRALLPVTEAVEFAETVRLRLS